ncbi:MAG: hypothetical protein QOC61_658 [Acidobacteriota bacterium]|jgi:hypothetical protein|nr:hypothetical protein [Acidobacteriota bacterium]MDT5261654.1 hypothetical protein [Acidobacteriota bacterium]MDT7780634.1 hypothetical protein [Acidobacteriota bacterium]
MPNNNIPNPDLNVDPSERTIDGGQSFEAEGISADAAEEQEGSALDKSEDSGGINAE